MAWTWPQTRCLFGICQVIELSDLGNLAKWSAGLHPFWLSKSLCFLLHLAETQSSVHYYLEAVLILRQVHFKRSVSLKGSTFTVFVLFCFFFHYVLEFVFFKDFYVIFLGTCWTSWSCRHRGPYRRKSKLVGKSNSKHLYINILT